MKTNDKINISSQKQLKWWQISGLVLFGFGIFAAILTLFPTYSPVALSVSIIFVFFGMVITIRAIWTQDWWGQFGYINIWMLLVLGTGIRAWNDVIPLPWLWLIVLPGFYILAWALPVIHPKLSAFLLREQLAPETNIGRGCMGWAIIIAPVAGGLGAVLGMYGSRYGQGKLVSLVGACLFTIVPLAIAQAVSHQFWPKRPWARSEKEGEP